MLRVLLPIPLILLLSPALGHADDAALAACGAAKVHAMARACSDLLSAEARLLATGNAEGKVRRLAKVRGRIVETWAKAEAQARDSGCATFTASPDGAVDFVDSVVSEILSSVPVASCGAKLGRRLRRHCRNAVELEVDELLAPAGAADERTKVIGRIRKLLSRRWPDKGCGTGPDANEVTRALFRLAGAAAGQGTTRGIRELADQVGLSIGVAIEPGEVATDPDYQSALVRESNSLTAENVMKWGPTQPGPTQFSFAGADQIMALADAEGMRVRGHTLVWGALQLPSYVQNASTAAELRGYMSDHIAGVIGQYAGRIAQWDVVNEPLRSTVDPATPDGLDDNIFTQLIGPGYIAEALHLARAADPTAGLFVNENGIVVPGPRQDRFYQLIVDLLAAGAPLDGVGLQAHVGLTPLLAYPTRDVVETSVRRFADLGLDVEITELDATVLFRPPDLALAFAIQGQDYRAYADGCFAVPRCTGITTWGLSDQYTWLRTFFGFDDYPLPFDDFWNRKPAYFGMRGSLLGRLLADS